MTVEAYPDIKSNTNFQSLQSQLEGTENRIAVARADYNEMARRYRTRIQTFPTVIFARVFGFEAVALFEAVEGSDKAPEVEFDFE